MVSIPLSCSIDSRSNYSLTYSILVKKFWKYHYSPCLPVACIIESYSSIMMDCAFYHRDTYHTTSVTACFGKTSLDLDITVTVVTPFAYIDWVTPFSCLILELYTTSIVVSSLESSTRNCHSYMSSCPS